VSLPQTLDPYTDVQSGLLFDAYTNQTEGD